MNEHAQLAKEYAEKIKTDLNSDELTELLLLANWDWPTKKDIIRMKVLLAGIDICWKYGHRLPQKWPFPPPFDTRQRVSYIIAKLRRAKSDAEKQQQLQEYLERREDDVLIEMIRKGPENVVYGDLPEKVSHAMVTRKLRPRLMRIIDGRDPHICIKEPEETKCHNENGHEDNS